MLTSLPQRIRTKIAVNSETGCWEWLGCRTRTGYGRVWNGKRSDWAHRVVFRLLRGPVTDGRVLDHLCRVHHCVNPEHLDPVTDLINTLRGVNPEVTRARHRAQAFCKRGHPLFGGNVYRHPSGRRVCRECNKLHKAAYAARRADVLLHIANQEPNA